ncbi:hypothetical protein CKN63_13455 [Carnobacterium divergens]|uniref:hypothetical protein n=1 Tax=Carnobacterium divergens TaxID=2748 RepID=UPI0010723420|nr:hypothetical protein [Carnobacterium divergens]TFI60565.1 hypothetical protein CKN59_13390 [Carnobacterium divergens]TFI61636.1 hypothetical protein CKN76_12595 [Carnobacterium divergens]TFJ01040.1 hypothetical protein CKN75_12980 [Carnobacterium divergens]TFJ08960.1 hypothetical protein CKN71_12995 [Carnobacterium divergens]TFJ15669.1 hypothetical protein CKN63_13455 [Carnobacterium divergens]
MITEIEREQLQEKMAKELGNKIEEIKQKGLINKVEYVLANDFLFESTENHSLIDYDNNVAKDMVEDEGYFISELKIAYQNMKKDYPNIDSMNETEINEMSASYADIF